MEATAILHKTTEPAAFRAKKFIWRDGIMCGILHFFLSPMPYEMKFRESIRPENGINKGAANDILILVCLLKAIRYSGWMKWKIHYIYGIQRR